LPPTRCRKSRDSVQQASSLPASTNKPFPRGTASTSECSTPAILQPPWQVAHLDIRRRDRLGGTLHEYRHAA